MSRPRYLRVRNWSRFQHYKNRSPAWIKVYTDLLVDDDFLGLTDAERGQLLTIWLVAAKKDNKLPNDARRLRRLCGSHASLRLSVLVAARFLEPWKSPNKTPANPRESASTLEKNAIPETEVDEKEEKEIVKGGKGVRPPAWKTPQPSTTEAAQRLALSVKADELAARRICQFAGYLPEAAFHSLREKIQLEGKSIRNPPGYVLNGLQLMVDEGQYRAA